MPRRHKAKILFISSVAVLSIIIFASALGFGLPLAYLSDTTSGNILSVVQVPPPIKTVPPSASAGSSSNYYWVGADTSGSTAYAGVEGTIQVISSSVSGSLEGWVSLDTASNIWGQVGWYLYNSATPYAFWQVWNLSSYTELATGTHSVTTGSHSFSMYLASGTTWAFALDGTVFGTYDMKASNGCGCYPVYALSEEGYVSSSWNPPSFEFSQIQVLKSGVWSSLASAQSYGNTWGVAGNLQLSSLPNDAFSVGGSDTPLTSGTMLWNGGTTTTTTTTTSSTTTSTSTTTSLSAQQSTSGTLLVSLSVLPATNTPKSTEYITVVITNGNGNPVSGASVTLTIVAPNGRSKTISTTTSGGGEAYFQYKLSAATPIGIYDVAASGSMSGYTSSSATAAFTVT